MTDDDDATGFTNRFIITSFRARIPPDKSHARRRNRDVSSHELLLGAAVLLIRVALFRARATRGYAVSSFPGVRGAGRESFESFVVAAAGTAGDGLKLGKPISWARTNSFTHPL